MVFIAVFTVFSIFSIYIYLIEAIGSPIKLERCYYIVVLGGNTKTRLKHAIWLYKRGYGKKIVVTCPAQEGYKTNSINSKNIIFLNGSFSTFSDARLLMKFFNDHLHRKPSFILVTDAIHAVRARHIFRVLFNNSFEVSTPKPENLFKNAGYIFSEILKYLLFESYRFSISLRGLNIKKVNLSDYQKIHNIL